MAGQSAISGLTFIGVSLDGLRILETGYHAWLRVKPPILLKLLGCSHISTASFMMQFIYTLTFPSMEILLKSILCSSTTRILYVAETHVSYPLCISSASLFNINFTTFSAGTVYIRDFQI
jgi:hypothetical protein